MTRSRLGPVARGLASLVLLVVVFFGPPVALVGFVGWPLPTSPPDLVAVERAARTGVSDQIIVKVLAAIAWLAWAQIALTLIAEVAGVLHGRPATHLPVFPGVQATVARLVAGIAMMSATLHPAPAAAIGTLAVAPQHVALVESPGLPLPLEAAPPVAPAVTARGTGGQPGPTIAVEPHDSYWAIAERCLGDGLRWREIRDLNVGRTMADGRIITTADEFLRPGWILHLPPSAHAGSADGAVLVVDQPAAGEPRPAPGVEFTVESGDSFWTLAERQVADELGRQPSAAEVHRPWQDLIHMNRDRLVQPGNPDLIFPGQRLARPATESASASSDQDLPGAIPPDALHSPAPQTSQGPTVPEVPPPQSTPAAPITAPATTPRSEGSHRNPATAGNGGTERGASSESRSIIALAGIAGAALAVGAKRAIQHRRHRVALAHPHTRPLATVGHEQNLHRQLVANADEGTLDELIAALACLAADLAATNANCRPRIVQHSSGHLDLFLDNATAAAPDGWQAHADGAVWTRQANATQPATDAVRCPSPLLVTLGQPDEGGQLYLDLEAEGIVALTGDPDIARNVARGMVTELSLTPLAETVQVMVLGALTDPAVARLEHVTISPGWEQVADDLTAWAEQSNKALVANHWPNAFVARGANPDHDALGPVVVIASEPPPPHLLDILRPHHPSTVAVVVCGTVAGPATVLDCQPDRLTLVDQGLTCTPHPMESDVLESIVELLDAAEEPGTEPLITVPDSGGDEDTEYPAADLTDPEYEVLVRLLGEIRVEGGEPLMPKQTAVVAYIALHDTVSAERLEDAVWASPTTTSRRKRLANTMSEARAAIGRRHLPASVDGRYSHGPGLTTDVELFDRRVRQAAEQSAADAVKTLRSALDLVTGRPFTYRNADRFSYTWVDLENLQSTWDLKIAAVAQHCAELHLDLAAPDGAVEVALHVLEAVPAHPGLTESLMRAHASNGDRSAVQNVYQAHLAALDKLDLDEVAESTADLFEQLRRATTT